ncbi:TPA: MFS transporter, partial [Streptococcus agalactiae]|nr:MFS transporter [Streptococcus agalactiae]
MNINGIKLLSSRAVSKLGDVLYDYGNSTWIASMGGLGQKILGIYQIVELLVSIVLNPFGGALADRFQRRKILLITDAICAIMCFLLSFIGDDKVMVYGLIVANAILAVSNA